MCDGLTFLLPVDILRTIMKLTAVPTFDDLSKNACDARIRTCCSFQVGARTTTRHSIRDGADYIFRAVLVWSLYLHPDVRHRERLI